MRRIEVRSDTRDPWDEAREIRLYTDADNEPAAVVMYPNGEVGIAYTWGDHYRYLDPPETGPTDDELRERWLPIIMAGWRAGDKSNTSAHGMAGDASRDVETLLSEHRQRQGERAEGGDDG